MKDTQNPEIAETSKEETKQTGLNTDELKSIVDGKMSLDALPPEKQKEFHQRFVVNGEELPEGIQPPEEGGTGEKAEEKQPQISQKPEKKLPEMEPIKEPDSDLKRKYYEKSNELNTAKQQLESTKKRLELLEKMKVEPKKSKEDDDVYSEESIKATKDRVASLEKIISDFMQGEKTHLQKERDNLAKQTQQLEEQNLFLSIHAFQGENQELRTERPFNVLNAAYAKFQNDVGGPEARERFFIDEAFRKQKENEGLVFPMDKETWNKYKTMVEVHNFRNEKGYPDYDSAYYVWRKEKGILQDQIKQAALHGSSAATRQIVENKTETKTLSPEHGSTGDGGVGMNEQQMLAWLEAHPYPKTPDEIRMQKKILAYVSSATPE